ncbi:MAG: hypothetical protein WC378_00050 [Opitutaceae bacterium]|jgi:hypothetical protein
MTTPDYAQMLLDDFELRDDLQEVTLTGSVTGEETTGIKAIVRSLNFREAMLGGNLGLEPTDFVWCLGCKQLGDVVPERGDTITTSDSTVWVIVSHLASSGFGVDVITRDVVARKQL